VRAIRRAETLIRRRPAEQGPFDEALRARTRWPFVAIALSVVYGIVFSRMLLGDGALSDPETLVAWGGNFGPRTTNGEWWRLLASTFVHAGILHLLVNAAAVVQVGLVLERLVGHAAFAAVYVAAAAAANLSSLSIYPMVCGVGASGAVFGLYGLLIASAFWGMLHRSSVTIPLKALGRLGPTAAVFVLYNAVSGSLGSEPELAGLMTGLVMGLALTREVGERKPAIRRVAYALGATAVIAAAWAIPLRGVADVRPEIDRIVALEDQMTVAYEAAVNQFKLGAIKAEALAQVIDRTIMPELHAAQGRLKAFDPDAVPSQHQPLVAGADEYLRLRDESWRLRAEALRKANMVTLRKADLAEWASLEALEKIKPADQK
jgi:membrane associated rhomboid family serine protease